MRSDDVALALIEARLASARERRLVAQVRQARREARRTARAGRRWWWWLGPLGPGEVASRPQAVARPLSVAPEPQPAPR